MKKNILKSLITNKKFLARTGWTLLVSVLLGILAIMSYYISQVYNEAPPIEKSSSSQTDLAQADDILDDPEFDAEIEAALEAGMIATLVSVTENEDYGIATREYTDGVFIYDVIVSIADPPPGYFYEGWLAQGRVISTGKLIKEDDNTYSSVFTSAEDLSDLDTVIITQETTANGLDGKPELHLLEGNF